MFVAFLPNKNKMVSRQSSERATNDWLTTTVREFQRRMAIYPPFTPWKNPPTTGIRAGGLRTGDYGQGWLGAHVGRIYARSARVTNPVSYARYVGGPRTGSGASQARVLAARGWRSSQDVAQEVIRDTAPGLVRSLARP